jgi:charged multivesicular body protein 2A
MMEMKQDVMTDAIDDVMEDDEQESEDVVNQVLEEIGIDLSQQLVSAPNNQVGPVVGGEVKEDDLQARLNMLRGE